jgi:hypothetical protein
LQRIRCSANTVPYLTTKDTEITGIEGQKIKPDECFHRLHRFSQIDWELLTALTIIPMNGPLALNQGKSAESADKTAFFSAFSAISVVN